MKRTKGFKARNVQFDLGFVSATRTAVGVLGEKQLDAALFRHSRGDWGDVGHQVRFANQRGLREHSFLFSRYHSVDGCEFWILTDLQLCMTTVYLPEDF